MLKVVPPAIWDPRSRSEQGRPTIRKMQQSPHRMWSNSFCGVKATDVASQPMPRSCEPLKCRKWESMGLTDAVTNHNQPFKRLKHYSETGRLFIIGRARPLRVDPKRGRLNPVHWFDGTLAAKDCMRRVISTWRARLSQRTVGSLWEKAVADHQSRAACHWGGTDLTIFGDGLRRVMSMPEGGAFADLLAQLDQVPPSPKAPMPLSEPD